MYFTSDLIVGELVTVIVKKPTGVGKQASDSLGTLLGVSDT